MEYDTEASWLLTKDQQVEASNNIAKLEEYGYVYVDDWTVYCENDTLYCENRIYCENRLERCLLTIIMPPATEPIVEFVKHKRTFEICRLGEQALFEDIRKQSGVKIMHDVIVVFDDDFNYVQCLSKNYNRSLEDAVAWHMVDISMRSMAKHRMSILAQASIEAIEAIESILSQLRAMVDDDQVEQDDQDDQDDQVEQDDWW